MSLSRSRPPKSHSAATRSPWAKEALFIRGRYIDIAADHFTIEPVGDGVTVRYVGNLEVTRVLARYAQDPVGALSSGADEGAERD
jgi:hypothetical protein